MPLNDAKVRAAKPGARLVKLSDGGGLQLWVSPDGAKRWRLAYRLAGAQKSLAIGVYPAIGLREAREAREETKRLLAKGQDPSLVKRLAKSAKATASANTFDAIAGELLDKKRREGKADRTIAKVRMVHEPRASGHRRAANRRDNRARNSGLPAASRRAGGWRRQSKLRGDDRAGLPLRGRHGTRRKATRRAR